MKKVLLAGAALMLVGGIASTASAAAVEPGVKITGDARVRFGYTSDDYLAQDMFGLRNGWDSQTNFDSRVRVNFAGTAAGGTYVKARIRMEGGTGDVDNDPNATADPVLGNNNTWVDLAYVGIPFNDNVTIELGRYRSTYGPLAATNNFFYDDVSSHGAKGIVKFGDVEINPFFEWMEEPQGSTTDYVATSTLTTTPTDAQTTQANDNDVVRLGAHAKGKINKDWTVGGLLGYQIDNRAETWNTASTTTGASAANTVQLFDPNEGFFGSVYVSGKTGPFALNAEFAVTAAELNNFNSWESDIWTAPSAYVASTSTAAFDTIGSKDTGYGGYVFPTYTIDKLTLGVNAGFTTGGFQPDRAFGFVMLGTADNSRISALRIGDFGDWLWGGLVASYQINESLKLTGNLVYADINAWDSKGINGDGPNTTSGSIAANTGTKVTGSGNTLATSPTGVNLALDSAWEISAVLQYTISKGTDLYLSGGYLKPEADGSDEDLNGAFGVLSRLEVKF